MLYDRYYYSKLNNLEKKAYKKIYDAMQNREETVTINGFAETDILKLMLAINFDNPHLFFVDFHYELRSELFGRTIILKYLYDENDTAIVNEKIKKVCNKILSKVTGKTEFEKELSLHDILAQNVLYDKAARKNLRKYHARSNTILGVLFYKTAVCEGIAKTLKFLLNALDIKCIVVQGKTPAAPDKNTFHAWNIAKIDGKAYHVDLTWDINLSEQNLVRHDYFNLTDKDISVDHTAQEHHPPCVSETHNYYRTNNLIATKTVDVCRIIAEKIAIGQNFAEFKIDSKTPNIETDVFNIVQNCLTALLRDKQNVSLRGRTPSERGVCYFEWESR